mmetsp:Transcript_7166/g.8594  ORF Transcript_7166/g.8594 Transcript_7166/m.8594 type:complete len:80 (-) Transcript_7166:411-650(-)
MLFLPESPRWLGIKNRAEQQKAVMRRIYKRQHLEKVNDTLGKEVDALREQTRVSECARLVSLCTTYRRCLLIGCGIQAF